MLKHRVLDILAQARWVLHKQCFSHPPAKKVREGMYCDSLGTFGSALAVPGLATQRDRAGRAHPVTDVLLMLLR